MKLSEIKDEDRMLTREVSAKQTDVKRNQIYRQLDEIRKLVEEYVDQGENSVELDEALQDLRNVYIFLSPLY